jgi:hypothetical protein
MFLANPPAWGDTVKTPVPWAAEAFDKEATLNNTTLVIASREIQGSYEVVIGIRDGAGLVQVGYASSTQVPRAEDAAMQRAATYIDEEARYAVRMVNLHRREVKVALDQPDTLTATVERDGALFAATIRYAGYIATGVRDMRERAIAAAHWRLARALGIDIGMSALHIEHAGLVYMQHTRYH